MRFGVSFCLFIFLFLGVGTANAATIYFSPSSGNFTVGDILTVSVLVDTGGLAINNSDAVINFPSGLLEVVSTTKSGSIFSLWVEEPAFSNSAGTISFNGGLPTPGFTGTAGKILNIVFSVRNAGTASLIFSSAAVRANDGYGTDILQTRAQAQLNLIVQEGPPQTPPAAITGTLKAPLITSVTHPDSSKWYTSNDPEFSWQVPFGVTSARLLVGRIPRATPTVVYTPVISQRTLGDLDDGVWYFHVQLKNSGGWSVASHFRFQIDTENPTSFNITEVKRTDPTDPQAKFIFDAKDRTSGIDYYEVQIDSGAPQTWNDGGSGIFKAPLLSPGKHTLTAKVVDKAGNSLTSSVEFTIEALEPPTISEYPLELESGEILIVKGITYPDAKVSLWLQREKEEARSYIVESGKDGRFVFISDERPKDGIYKLWAEVVDKRGSRSEPTEKLTIVVKKTAINYPMIIIILIVLIVLLLLFLWYSWYRFAELKKRIIKEVLEAERALHKSTDILKNDFTEQIRMLEHEKSKRKLTHEEEKVIRQIKKNLDDVEKFVQKEIRDIKREVE